MSTGQNATEDIRMANGFRIGQMSCSGLRTECPRKSRLPIKSHASSDLHRLPICVAADKSSDSVVTTAISIGSCAAAYMVAASGRLDGPKPRICGPSAPYAAGEALQPQGSFTVGSRSQTRSAASASMNDFTSFGPASAMHPSSRSSPEIPAFSRRASAGST